MSTASLPQFIKVISADFTANEKQGVSKNADALRLSKRLVIPRERSDRRNPFPKMLRFYSNFRQKVDF